jgi:hypothetical protein
MGRGDREINGGSGKTLSVMAEAAIPTSIMKQKGIDGGQARWGVAGSAK